MANICTLARSQYDELMARARRGDALEAAIVREHAAAAADRTDRRAALDRLKDLATASREGAGAGVQDREVTADSYRVLAELERRGPAHLAELTVALRSSSVWTRRHLEALVAGGLVRHDGERYVADEAAVADLFEQQSAADQDPGGTDDGPGRSFGDHPWFYTDEVGIVRCAMCHRPADDSECRCVQ